MTKSSKTEAAAPAAPTTILTVPLDDLAHDPIAIKGHEARLTQLDDLLASLPAKGQLQSLKVRPSPSSDVHSEYWVTAGNRRLAALQRLQKDGGSIRGVKVTGDFPVHVIVSDESDADAYESSRSENLQRLPETPVEEFRAFAKMAESKTPREIAAVFGITEKRVQQRLKLAALHTDVIAALEAGKITMEAAQAFTIEPNPKKQAAYLKKAQSWDLNPGTIKRAFTEQLVSGDSPVARLIGKDAYIAAGGQILGDAFNDRAAYWISPDVIAKLSEERMAGQKAAWLEEGWSFVETAGEYLKGTPDYEIYRNRLEPVGEPDFGDNAARAAEVKTRMAELEAEHPKLSYNEYDPSIPDEVAEEYDALVGELDRLAIGEGTFTAEQRAIAGVIYWPDMKREPVLGLVREGTVVPKGLGGRDDDEDGGRGADLRDPGWDAEKALADMKSQGLALKLSGDSTLALRVLVAQLRHGRNYNGVLGLSRNFTIKHKAPNGFIEAYAEVRGMDLPALIVELADMVAGGVSISQHVDVGQLIEDAGAATSFSGKAYFAKLSKPLLRAAWRDMRSPLDKDFVELADGELKAMAKAVGKLADETGWLPPQLRTSSYTGPKFVTGDEPVVEADEGDEADDFNDDGQGEDEEQHRVAAE